MKKFGLAVKAAIAATAIMTYAIGPASAEYSFGDLTREARTNVCSFHAENPPKYLVGHYAFATNEDGSSCGWSYGLTTEKYAVPAALNICQLGSKTPCEIQYSK